MSWRKHMGWQPPLPRYVAPLQRRGLDEPLPWTRWRKLAGGRPIGFTREELSIAAAFERWKMGNGPELRR